MGRASRPTAWRVDRHEKFTMIGSNISQASEGNNQTVFPKNRDGAQSDNDVVNKISPTGEDISTPQALT